MGIFNRNKKLSEDELQDILFDLRMNSKSLNKLAAKEFKRVEAEKKKVADAIAKGNREVAEIYAQNAIRINKTGVNYLNLSARLDACRSKIETSSKMGALSKDIKKMNKVVADTLMSQNPEQVMAVMDKFNEQFDELDVRTSVVNNAMGARTDQMLPGDEVRALISKVAEEQMLDASSILSEPGVAVAASKAATGDQTPTTKAASAVK